MSNLGGERKFAAHRMYGRNLRPTRPSAFKCLELSFPGLMDTFPFVNGNACHAENQDPYPAEFRDQIVAMARAGRSVESLAREFEPCVAMIHGWIKQAERDGGLRDDGLISAEREELRRLRRENHQLRMERDILSKAAAWFAANDVTSSRSSNS